MLAGMKNWILVVFLMSAPVMAADPISIHGSSTLAELSDALARAYEKVSPSARFDLNTSDSTKGIADLIAGRCSIAASSRSISAAEAAKLRGLVAVPVARDGVAIFVHRDNPVTSLPMKQLAAILSGETKNWKEVGGRDIPIQVYDREEGSATRKYVAERLLGTRQFASTAIGVMTTNAMLDAVGGDKRAIGFAHYVHTASVKAVAISSDGGSPVRISRDTVVAGTYPMSRILYFYATEPDAETRKFLTWLHSSDARTVVIQKHYFPAR